jgi:spore maturation protein CgeB
MSSKKENQVNKKLLNFLENKKSFLLLSEKNLMIIIIKKISKIHQILVMRFVNDKTKIKIYFNISLQNI